MEEYGYYYGNHSSKKYGKKSIAYGRLPLMKTSRNKVFLRFARCTSNCSYACPKNLKNISTSTSSSVKAKDE